MKKTKSLIVSIILLSLMTLIFSAGEVQAANYMFFDLDCDYVMGSRGTTDGNAFVGLKVVPRSSTPTIVGTQYTSNGTQKVTIPANEIAEYQFTSSDEKVGTIDATTGKITIKSTGRFAIRSKGVSKFVIEVIEDSKYQQVKESRKIPTDLIVLGENTQWGPDEMDHMEAKMTIGAKAQIYNKVNGENKKVTDVFKTIKFSSENNNIATVDKNGIITAVGEGNTMIVVDCGDYMWRFVSVTVTNNENKGDTAKTEEVNTVTVKANKDESVPSSVFTELAKSNDRTLIVESENVSWKFKGANVKKTNIDFLPSVTISNKAFSAIKNSVIKKGIFIDFKHNGDLPGKAEVTINVGTDKYGKGKKTLYLYHYNTTTNSYEYVSEASYNAGIVKAEIEHCSYYALTDKKIASRELDKDPKTGNNSVFAIELIAIIALAGAIIGKKYLK